MKLPDGRTFTLGSVSVLKLVVSLAPNGTTARRTLDDFLANGESMLSVNLDDLDSLLSKPRARWAGGKSLIPNQERTASTEGSTMNETEFERKLTSVERHLHTLSEVTLASSDAEKHVVASLVNNIRDLLGLRTASERGTDLANRIIATLGETADRVEILENIGRPVDVDTVRIDLHKIASRVADLASDGGVLGGAISELTELHEAANLIHSYFV